MNCLAFFEATKASIKLCFKITMFSRTISIDCNFSLRLSCLFVIFNTFLNFFLKQLGFSLPIYCHSLSLFDNFFSFHLSRLRFHSFPLFELFHVKIEYINIVITIATGIYSRIHLTTFFKLFPSRFSLISSYI